MKIATPIASAMMKNSDGRLLSFGRFRRVVPRPIVPDRNASERS